MQKFKTSDFLSMDLTKLKTDELRKAISIMSTTANKSLRRLEETGFSTSSKAYQYFEQLAFDSDVAVGKTGKGQMKFKTGSRGMTHNQMVHTAVVIKDFLESKTSKVSGTKQAYLKGYKTFQKKHKFKGTQQEYAEAFSVGLLEQFSLIYGSEQVARFVTYANSKGLSSSDIEKILKDGGLRGMSKDNKASLSFWEDKIDNFRKVTPEEQSDIDRAIEESDFDEFEFD